MMYNKVIITRPEGDKSSNSFDSIRDAKSYARKNSHHKDRVQIIEEDRDEITILYDYIVEDWSNKFEWIGDARD